MPSEQPRGFPIYHLLDGNSERGYTVAVNVCQDVPDRRLTFKTLTEAAECLAQLPGEAIEDLR